MTNMIYACGPITGQTADEANDWRENLVVYLHGTAKVLSPMRGKDYLPEGKLEAYTNVEHEVGSVLSGAKGILARDYWDVSRCDVLFAYFSATERVSIGSVMEIAFAHTMQKPIVAVIDEKHDHPFVTECVTHLCPDFKTAVEVTRRLF